MTRAREDVASLERALQAQGVRPVATPLLRFALLDPAPLVRLIAGPRTYDWLVCTSRHAVEQLEAACAFAGVKANDGRFVRVGAVGHGTARALESLGVTVDLVPQVSDAAHLARTMLGLPDATGAGAASPPRVLFPRARAARETLPTLLREARWIVDDVACYETLACTDGGSQLTEALAQGLLGAVTLASGSASRAMASLVPTSLWAAARLVSIGPTTTAAAHAAGLTIAAESPLPSMDALADTTRRLLLDSLAHA